MSQSHAYRPLLPATRLHPPRPTPTAPRKKRISIACDGCRHKHTRCDGNRPGCVACAVRSSTCTYTIQDSDSMQKAILKRENKALREDVAAFHAILDLLRTKQPEDIYHSLHYLPAGDDPMAMLQSLQTQPALSSSSKENAARGFLPAAHSDDGLGSIHYPITYPDPHNSSIDDPMDMDLSLFDPHLIEAICAEPPLS